MYRAANRITAEFRLRTVGTLAVNRDIPAHRPLVLDDGRELRGFATDGAVEVMPLRREVPDPRLGIFLVAGRQEQHRAARRPAAFEHLTDRQDHGDQRSLVVAGAAPEQPVAHDPGNEGPLGPVVRRHGVDVRFQQQERARAPARQLHQQTLVVRAAGLSRQLDVVGPKELADVLNRRPLDGFVGRVHATHGIDRGQRHQIAQQAACSLQGDGGHAGVSIADRIRRSDSSTTGISICR